MAECLKLSNVLNGQIWSTCKKLIGIGENAIKFIKTSAFLKIQKVLKNREKAQILRILRIIRSKKRTPPGNID